MADQTQLRFSFRNCILLAFLLLRFFDIQAVSGAKWDGVIVTQADSQSLEAIKHGLVDPRGVLRSWNDSGIGACSGWIGIKCVKGQVIAIQLPWKGLGGRISEKIGQLQSLRRLSLHDNALVGPIPTSLGFLPNLRGMYLFNNRLSGSIPPSIGNCPLLQTLDLSNNQLGGTIPPTLANSTRLYRLNLSFNGLSGSIPSSLSHSPSLTFLALQYNYLSGPVPDSWGADSVDKNVPYQLQFLSIDHNLLSGKIPASLSKLTMLQQIKLSHNEIDGSIPESLSNLSSLVFLDLSENNLTGGIPLSLSNLQNLSSFNVSYNDLSGVVPSDLANKFNSSSFAGNIQLCGYGSTPCSSPPPGNSQPPSKHHRRRRLSTKDIILIAAGALLVLLLILCCVLLCCLIGKRKPGKKGGSRAGSSGGVGGKGVQAAGTEVESSAETGGKLVHFDGPFVFTADDLLCATAEIMGKSSYGTAYKATLEDNNQVAVKRLREKITKAQKEFEHEVSELGKIRHPNILSLRAYYLGPKGEKLLVYDYMPNGSLASFLHARGPETSIPWATRMSIAIGVTRGLCYLHADLNMVHGNLTASNVLLDQHNEPRIADVGLSRLMTSAATGNVVATAGSLGYRAPEFSKLKNGSTKTDVFSLGVIILELLTGKSPSEAKDGLDLPQWVASIVKEEWTNEVFEVEIMRDASNNGDELLNTLKLALHCVDPSPLARPDAQQLLQKLQDIKMEAAAAEVTATQQPPLES